MKIYVEFLGIPKIYINNRWIKINKNKLNMIILYILYNENCTRDELSAIFWPESGEKRAKSNLRNAIYQIRKKLGEKVLDVEGHSHVGIKKDVKISKDIDVFLEGDNADSILKLQNLIFMENGYLKDNNQFNDWVIEVRVAYEKIIINILEAELENSIRAKNYKLIEKYANKIIEIDIFNEKAYREKIKINIRNHDYNEGIKNYKDIEKVVMDELGVELEDETIELYNFMLVNKNSAKKNESTDYFSRTDLSYLIRKEYTKFIESEDFKHIIVRGEIGVGKTRIIDNFLDDLGCEKYILELNKTITNIEALAFKKMLSLFKIENGLSIDASIHEFEEKIRGKDKIILYIKNLEYVDKKSFDYFSELIINLDQENIFTIAEFSDSLSNDILLGQELKTLKNTRSIDVPLLSKDESIDYIKFKYPNYKSGDVGYNRLYGDTFGNIMFIDEYIQGKSRKDNRIVELLLNNLDNLELKILRRASIFEEYFTIADLKILINEDQSDLLEVLERLVLKSIIYEDEKKMKIKYKSLKNTVYDRIPSVSRIEMHKKLAGVYEEDNDVDHRDCDFLSYHFARAGDDYKKYFYHLKSLQFRLDYYDQFFPTLSNFAERPKEVYFNRRSYYKEYNNLYENIKKIRYIIPGKSYYELVMILEFLIGRTKIGGGLKKEGIAHIDNTIEMARELDNKDYVLKSYIEYIHYGIHKEENHIMGEYIELAKELIDKEKNYIEYAEVMRLEGLYQLKENNLEEAELLIEESIKAYSIPDLTNRNMFPIVAANNYLGNLYSSIEDYDRAKNYYCQGIDICIEHDIKKSLDIVYTDYGYMLYKKKNYNQAEQILRKAISVYDELGTHWKRTVAEVALGEIALKDQNVRKAISHLRSAEIYSKKDQKSEELKMLNDLKRKISREK